ncbi:MAG: S-adenosyl-l-methionine hydroxide adenosyltransferase family protein [Gaiellaceae bacterium]
MVITFLTDFGLDDDFVGVCHGVIRRIAPDAEVIDVTHGIRPQAVLEGALVLANALPYMPEGIHLAVVDPEVGGKRRPVALRTQGGILVGPDNGLLVPAAERLGGVDEARELTNRSLWLERVSRTFHARDIFAPVAAHLAAGVSFEHVGEPFDPAALVRIELPEPSVAPGKVTCRCLAIDRFGNVQLNVRAEHLGEAGIERGNRVEIVLTAERYSAVAAATFADVGPGEIVVYEDAYENVSIAISRGSAADTFTIEPGDAVAIVRLAS